ncbi:MAG TPA: hypothetical protein VFU63_03045, partial [Ktedonobacterales bacterium]|nr:hypothetical protein [Ktedonobacterales bacterium]
MRRAATHGFCGDVPRSLLGQRLVVVVSDREDNPEHRQHRSDGRTAPPFIQGIRLVPGDNVEQPTQLLSQVPQSSQQPPIPTPPPPHTTSRQTQRPHDPLEPQQPPPPPQPPQPRRFSTGRPGNVNVAPPRLQSPLDIPDEFEGDVAFWNTQMLPALSPEARRQLAAQQRRVNSSGHYMSDWSTMLMPGAPGTSIGGSTVVTQAMAAQFMSVAVPTVAPPMPTRKEPSVAGKVIAGSLVQGIGKLLTYI